MKFVGILSDTHSYVHPRIVDFFSGVDEIWHAGDIGDAGVMHQLGDIRPVRAVHGNIDGADVRLNYPEIQLFQVESVKVLMLHIGGYPGHYSTRARQLIEQEKPKLFVCGHSHILKVMYDPKFDLLHINPGSAGKSGMHRSITAVRLIIENGNMRDLEVCDIPRQ